MNQGSNFLGGTFSNRDSVTAPIQFRREINPSILKEDFSSRTNSSVFTLIAPVLLDQSDKTSQVFPALKSDSKGHISLGDQQSKSTFTRFSKTLTSHRKKTSKVIILAVHLSPTFLNTGTTNET